MNDTPHAPRIGIYKHWPEGYKAMRAFSDAVRDSGLDPRLMELVKIRASQINRCAFCLNMHVADARQLGETEQRLALLPAFEEAACYTPAEKAALALTEAMTELSAHGVPDAVFDRVRPHFDPAQISKLIFAVTVINAWNRLSVADQTPIPVDAAPVVQRA